MEATNFILNVSTALLCASNVTVIFYTRGEIEICNNSWTFSLLYCRESSPASKFFFYYVRNENLSATHYTDLWNETNFELCDTWFTPSLINLPSWGSFSPQLPSFMTRELDCTTRKHEQREVYIYHYAYCIFLILRTTILWRHQCWGYFNFRKKICNWHEYRKGTPVL